MLNWLVVALLAVGSLDPATDPGSPIKTDEEIVFFATLAKPAADGAWEIPIHGWIFEREWAHGAALRWAAEAGVEEQALTPEEAAVLVERAHWFVLDGERGKDIAVRIAGRVVSAGVSGPDGHFRADVRLSDAELHAAVERRGGHAYVPFRAVMRPDDPRVFAGEVTVIGTTGVSVISDIDDTIKITGVHARNQLVDNTFFQPMQPVPGTPHFLRALAGLSAGSAFHYVSASPWQLYVPLAEFLATHGFPPGTLHLRALTIDYATAREHFAVPDDYKLEQIKPMFQAFPKRRFVLIGDASERDPEAYAALARQFPTQVVRIHIRATPGYPPESPRFPQVFAGLPANLWKVFTDAPNAIGD